MAGGAVYLQDRSAARFADCDVSDNFIRSSGHAGAFFGDVGATYQIFDTTIMRNSADDGCAVFLTSARMMLARSTIAHNTECQYAHQPDWTPDDPTDPCNEDPTYCSMAMAGLSFSQINLSSGVIFNNSGGDQWVLSPGSSVRLASCAPGTYHLTGVSQRDPFVSGGECPQRCSPGRYAGETASRNFDGASSCTGSGAGEPCTACPVGYYCPQFGSSEPLACPSGTYGDTPGLNSRACSGFCAAGFFCPTNSSKRRFSPCPPGRFSEGNASECSLCAVGQFQNKEGKPFCKPCVPGTYLSNPSKPCSPCAPGHFTNTSLQTRCQRCQAGYYADRTGSTICTACSAGRYNSATALTTPCALCPPGSFTNVTASTACVECGDGEYQPESGKTICLACVPGRFLLRPTAIEICPSCPAGFAAPESFAQACAECHPGTYATQGMSGCLACPPRTASAERATDVAACYCTAPYWRDEGDCKPCPPHAVCPDNCSRPTTAAGYWRVPWRMEHDDEARLECLSFKACLGPANASSNQTARCADHHEGPLCAACSRGAFRATGTYECVQCAAAPWISTAVVIGLALTIFLVISGVTAVTLGDGGEASPVDIVVLKITVNHFVIVSAAGNFPLEWPGFVHGMMTAMGVASASALGESTFSLDCVMGHGSIRPLHAWSIVTVVAPPVVLAAAYLFWRARCSTRYMETHFPVTALVTLVLAHPTICKAAFSLLSCRSVGSRAFLEADLSLQCNSEEYASWALGLGLPSLIIYGVGIPLFYFVCMRTLYVRGTLTGHRAVYGFLFSGYREHRWWYELWNCVRKAMFTGVAILLTPLGPAMQAWGSLLMLTIFLTVFLVGDPYLVGWLNDLERNALCVDAATLFLGLALFLNASNSSDSRSEGLAMALSVSVLLLNVCFLLRVCLLLIRHSEYAGKLANKLRFVCHRTSPQAVVSAADDTGKAVEFANPMKPQPEAGAYSPASRSPSPPDAPLQAVSAELQC